jgi:predicted RNase H-like HicB family nuclease
MQFQRAKRKMKGDSMQFAITIDRDENGDWVSECPAIPGCVSQGRSREEAIENIRDAIKNCLIVRAERGLPLTLETHLIEVVA